MDHVVNLWAPILLSAALVFVASSISWMVLPFHHKEWKGLPQEDAFRGTITSMGIGPGQYCFPHCDDMKKMKDPAFKGKMESGPQGTLSVWARRRPMPLCLGFSFAFYILVGVFVAYIGSLAVPQGAAYLTVFRITGTAAVMGYALGFIPGAFWFGRSVSSILVELVDGIVYGLLTAGAFAWLWPTTAVPVVGG